MGNDKLSASGIAISFKVWPYGLLNDHIKLQLLKVRHSNEPHYLVLSFCYCVKRNLIFFIVCYLHLIASTTIIRVQEQTRYLMKFIFVPFNSVLSGILLFYCWNVFAFNCIHLAKLNIHTRLKLIIFALSSNSNIIALFLFLILNVEVCYLCNFNYCNWRWWWNTTLTKYILHLVVDFKILELDLGHAMMIMHTVYFKL